MTFSSFSASYAEARSKFLDAATDAGASLTSYSHPEQGPDSGALFTDCAWIGPKDAKSVLVLVSGTHGVEGFCGSGAQIDWLHAHSDTLGPLAEQIKAQIFGAFYVDTDIWRGMVLGQSLMTVRQTIAGLSRASYL